MGRAALANPRSKQNEQARMTEARWLVQQLGREAVEAKLPAMSEDDQRIVLALLDEYFPQVVQ